MHVPFEQVVPQTWLHAPQCCCEVLMSAHCMPHCICPAGQAQTPAVQAAPVGQRLPQVPQFSTLDWVSTQTPPHRAWPAVAQLQLPALHELPAGHLFPHRPQLAGSV
jgi:hypothetical protein